MHCSYKAVPLIAAFAVASTQTINPNSVDIGTRTSWCNSQTAQCPLLCAQEQNGSQAVSQNSCNPQSLAYQCICGNNLTPNASQYSLTIPYYECTTAANQCVGNCSQADNSCKNDCRTSHPCGAQDPTRVNITTASSTSTGQATSTASGSGIINGSGARNSAAVNLVDLGRVCGAVGILGLTFGGMAGFL